VLKGKQQGRGRRASLPGTATGFMNSPCVCKNFTCLVLNRFNFLGKNFNNTSGNAEDLLMILKKASWHRQHTRVRIAAWLPSSL
jgi:hypothetical protein